jgi:glutamate synthase domain-containing protein 2
MIQQVRGYVLPSVSLVTLGLAALGLYAPAFWYGLILFGPLLALGAYDYLQRRHSVLRNYPILGHLRFFLEDIGPELHQYFVESNTDGRPFSREERSLVYERAQGVDDAKPFGTELDVYAPGYRWINHSIKPSPVIEDPGKNMRVEVGTERCEKPYSASLLNVSAMSFGALSPHAVLALNAGAKMGGFAHNTGEGGLSRYHHEPGGDLIFQFGTGYFGCRTGDGRFDPAQFAETARIDQVKMIELKLSQGAKPGHGGILPAAKVSEEIAQSRGVPAGKDCISPRVHSAFSTPIEMMELIAELRSLSGGKPVGFKLCIGDPVELLSVCKAMIETRLLPDFITIDGAEGGTGAAPAEFSDRLGVPLYEGLWFAHNALVGCGLRGRIRLAASGKRLSAFGIATAMALGADWCNAARPFMFAVGCIQAQSCHTNRCPVGVCTQNPKLYRALVVEPKAKRAYRFHRHTLESLAEFTSAAGLEHPRDFRPRHIWERTSPTEARSFDEVYEWVEPGQLLEGKAGGFLQRHWERADARGFG